MGDAQRLQDRLQDFNVGAGNLAILADISIRLFIGDPCGQAGVLAFLQQARSGCGKREHLVQQNGRTEHRCQRQVFDGFHWVRLRGQEVMGRGLVRVSCSRIYRYNKTDLNTVLEYLYVLESHHSMPRPAAALHMKTPGYQPGVVFNHWESLSSSSSPSSEPARLFALEPVVAPGFLFGVSSLAGWPCSLPWLSSSALGALGLVAANIM